MALSEILHSNNRNKKESDIFNPPRKLSSNNPIETSTGIWHIDGGIAILEANVFGLDNHVPDVPKVKDINAYASQVLENEITKTENPHFKPEIRKPLSFKKIRLQLQF